MFNKNLLNIYRLFLNRGGRKINWMEKWLGFDDVAPVSDDDKMNESNTYAVIFSDEHRQEMEQIFQYIINNMKGLSYIQCEDSLEALAFIQEISATGLWKYHQNVGTKIEKFIRDFDRLDVPTERIRLYENIQSHKMGL